MEPNLIAPEHLAEALAAITISALRHPAIFPAFNPLPYRVQRLRSKGWRMPENTVYVGRGSKWGNPHRIGSSGPNGQRLDAAMTCQLFKADLLAGRLRFTCSDVQDTLRGRNLACWCRPTQPCHANILLSIANTAEVQHA